MSLAEALLDEFGQEIAELKLIPGFGGMFEVTIGNQLVFSKKQQHRHPTIEEIKRLLRTRMAA